MKKVMKLTEEDLKRIITKILNEDDEFDYDLEDYKKANDYAHDLFEEIDDAIHYNLISCLESMNLGGMVREAQSMFKDRYPEYASTHELIENEHITSLMRMSQNPDLENAVSWMIDGMDNGDVLIVDKK